MGFRSALVAAIKLLQLSHKVQSALSERVDSFYLFDDMPDRLLDELGVPRDSLPPLSDAGDSDETAFSEQSAEQFVSLVTESSNQSARSRSHE